jgi:hypothetical protein
MHQEPHSESVRGVQLAWAPDWNATEADLSPARCAKLAESPGRFFVIARYD